MLGLADNAWDLLGGIGPVGGGGQLGSLLGGFGFGSLLGGAVPGP